MSLITIGLNHKTAPVHIRERVAFDPEKLPDVLHNLTAQTRVNEAAILSTCNRTEMLCCSDQSDSAVIIDWFRKYHNLTNDEVAPYLYIYPDQDAVRHVLRVASGLDSLVLGEPQILGQLKLAYSTRLQYRAPERYHRQTAWPFISVYLLGSQTDSHRYRHRRQFRIRGIRYRQSGQADIH